MTRPVMRRMLRRTLLTLLVLLAGAGWHLNWIGLERSWSRASGWDSIPDALRPPLTSTALKTIRADWPVLHWLGHAGFLVEWNGVRLLVDPNTAEWVNVSRRVMVSPAAPETWGRVDAALVTHGHMDHLVRSTLSSVPRLDRVILPAGSEGYVEGLRNAETRVMGARLNEPIAVGPVEVIPVPAAHNGSRWHPWGSDKKAFGYVLRAGGECVYFAGDTGGRNDFASIRDRYHPALVILPIGAYSPYRLLRIHHLSPDDAVSVARVMEADMVVPCHFGTFALSLDAPAAALPAFARAAAAAGQEWAVPLLLDGPRP